MWLERFEQARLAWKLIHHSASPEKAHSDGGVQPLPSPAWPAHLGADPMARISSTLCSKASVYCVWSQHYLRYSQELNRLLWARGWENWTVLAQSSNCSTADNAQFMSRAASFPLKAERWIKQVPASPDPAEQPLPKPSCETHPPQLLRRVRAGS